MYEAGEVIQSSLCEIKRRITITISNVKRKAKKEKEKKVWSVGLLLSCKIKILYCNAIGQIAATLEKK